MCDDHGGALNKIDNEICERLRLENPQQLHTLVRMHLSFELDMNTDDRYEAVYCEKGKLKKWNRLHKKAKGCTSINKNGSSPGERSLTREGVLQVQQLIDFLMEDQNIKQEGIFRKTGSLSRQNDLKSQLALRTPLNLHNSIYNVHDCASVLKNFLGELPEPLLTDAYYPVHGQLAEICNNDDTSTSDTRELRLLRAIQLLVLLLPEDNRILFQKIIEMLHKTAEYECNNKMSADSLSTIFTPHLIITRKLPPESLHVSAQSMSGIVSFMISKGDNLFEIPPRLSTDIHVYFEQKSTKSMALDESITNTVYTFCDREKTKAEHDAYPTDQALAQLYAHIQTLPESSKKRKLIKQFNKENGHGTPLQYLLLNRMKTGSTSSALKNTKSLGDSIKKHIFHKNLLSRTPKKPSSPFIFTTNDGGTPQNYTPSAHSLNNSGFNTPVRGLTIPPKMRVLFQSPLTISSSSNSLEQLENSAIGKHSSNSSTHDNVLKLNKTKDDDGSDKENYEDNNDEEDDNFGSDDSGSPLIFARDRKLKSHYKSEPNLSQIETPTETTPHVKNFANRLIKGVSMSNLKLSIFSSTSSHTGKQRGLMGKRRKESFHTAIHIKKEEHENLRRTDGDHAAQTEHLTVGDEVYWNSDYIMGTPVTNFIGRNSMSPITKSTQRMPKSMQESIMTPRSRKPVVLLGTNLSSSDTNQSVFYKSCSSLNEEDEDEMSDLVSHPTTKTMLMSMQRAKSLDSLNTNQTINCTGSGLTKIDNSFASSNPESLTSEFRDYLFSRSVLTASPADLSFSSQPDDFGNDADDGQTADIPNLSETEMSESLLYCLDGNKPDDLSFQSDENDHSSSSSNSSRDVDGRNSNMNCGGVLINTRKRPSDVVTAIDLNDDGNMIETFQIKKMVLKNDIELDETSL